MATTAFDIIVIILMIFINLIVLGASTYTFHHRRCDQTAIIIPIPTDDIGSTTAAEDAEPDITIISPVFDTNTNEIIFFTASRGHHADIGGILPGSMPPTSTSIFEEGAHIESFKIVNEGMFDQKGLYETALAFQE